MTAIRTSMQNAFETTLTAEMGPNDLTAQVASIGTLTTPCYIVIEMEDDAQREYILMDGTFGASAFVTTNVSKRYLAGSAAGSNITHPIGKPVQVVALAQAFEDLHDRIEGLAHGDLQNLSENDHPQYLQVINHTTAAHNALNIDADTLDGINSSGFSVATHNHNADYAALAHVGAVGGAHGPVTTGTDGFMSAADKTALDSLVASGTPPPLTDQEHLDAIKNVDGVGSGLDADLLDGVQLAALGPQVLAFDSIGVAGDTIIGTGGTDHHTTTFTKPAGWTSYDLLVTAIAVYKDGSSGASVITGVQIDGGGGGSTSGPIDSVSESLTLGGASDRTGLTANATLKMRSTRIGGTTAKATSTVYSIIATRRS